MSKLTIRNGRTHLSLLVLVAALALAGTAAAAGGGLPPQLGKQCGSVSGASWRFQGHTGTQYIVIAKTAAMCAAGMKSVGRLTKQKPHQGEFGPQTLTGPRGFKCLLTLPAAHTGYCGTTGNSVFYWGPKL